MDISVSSLSALSDIHVWPLVEGTTAWVSEEEDFFVLFKMLGATADGLNVAVPNAGAPIAGFPDASWVRSSSTSVIVGPAGSSAFVNRVELFDDFFVGGSTLGPLGWTVTGVTRAGSFVDKNHFGTRASEVAANGTTASYQFGSGAITELVLNDSPVYIETLIRFPLRSDGTNDYLARFGFGNQATNEHTNGAWFDYDIANSPNWRINTARSGVYTRTVTTVVVQEGVWMKLGIRFVPGATRLVEFYIAGVLVGSHTANLPDITTAITAYYSMVKTLGATARLYWQDYFLLQYQFATPR